MTDPYQEPNLQIQLFADESSLGNDPSTSQGGSSGGEGDPNL